MGSLWIIFSMLCISAWESAGITNKGRPPAREGILRNFRHVAGPSANINTDWEVGLREAVNQALLRERYHEYNLRNRLLNAPLIGRHEAISPFGDIVILARGQLYMKQGGNFIFAQDNYKNDCHACHQRARCIRSHCQVWQPQENEQLVALWTVKRLRHRNHNNDHYYELEYTISPITTPELSNFAIRNGHFNYGIPGHIFVVKNDKISPNILQPPLNNRRLPYPFKTEVLIDISEEEEKRILQSYPGFYTSLPVHPTYYQNRYSTNDPKEIQLYKELIDSLAAKTSSTHKIEAGPHKFSLKDYTESGIKEMYTTKPNYDSFLPPTKPLVEQATTTIKDTHTYTSIPYPQTSYEQNIATKPSIINMIPTTPTEFYAQEFFSHDETVKPKEHTIPKTAKPVTTTIHYFMPTGEEELVKDGFTEMRKITLATTSTRKPNVENPEYSGLEFLFPILEESTTPTRTTTKYKATTISQDVTNILEEPSSSPTLTTKQYQTNSKVKPKPTSTTPETIDITKATLIKSIIAKTTNQTSTQKPSTSNVITKLTTSTARMSKMTTKKPTPSETPKQTFKTSFDIPTTHNMVPVNITKKITTKTDAFESTTMITEIPSTVITKSMTPKKTTKTKQSNFTGFISSTSTSKVNKVTTYKPKVTLPKMTRKSKTTKFVSETTAHMEQTTTTTLKPKQLSTILTSVKTTTPRRLPIDLDYTLLEDILPTEPMTTLKPKAKEPTVPSLESTTNTIFNTNTVATQLSNEVTNVTSTLTKEYSSTTTAATTLKTTMTISIPITTTEVSVTTTELQHTTAVNIENTTDENSVLNKEIEEATKMEEPQITNLSNSYSTQENNAITETPQSRNASDLQSEKLSTMTSTMQHTEVTTPLITSKENTSSIKLLTTTINTFLMESDNGEQSISSKPIKLDFDEEDIFGTSKIVTKPTKASTVKYVVESELASELFGNINPKSEPTETKGTEIIYSNFFQPSTIPMSPTTEYVSQAEIQKTTKHVEPLTRQSYATSISFEVNRNKNRNQTILNAPMNNFTTEGVKTIQPVTSSTDANSLETKKTFDHLALQLVNHARSINFLNEKNNTTNKMKYRKRKTYIPKSRRLNNRRKIK